MKKGYFINFTYVNKENTLNKFFFGIYEIDIEKKGILSLAKDIVKEAGFSVEDATINIVAFNNIN